MKLNVIIVFRNINSFKLQGIHFYIIDIHFSENQVIDIFVLILVRRSKVLGFTVR